MQSCCIMAAKALGQPVNLAGQRPRGRGYDTSVGEVHKTTVRFLLPRLGQTFVSHTVQKGVHVKSSTEDKCIRIRQFGTTSESSPSITVVIEPKIATLTDLYYIPNSKNVTITIKLKDIVEIEGTIDAFYPAGGDANRAITLSTIPIDQVTTVKLYISNVTPTFAQRLRDSFQSVFGFTNSTGTPSTTSPSTPSPGCSTMLGQQLLGS